MNKYLSVWHIIQNSKGGNNAINQHKITDQYIRLNGEDISCREVRRIIRELRQEGYPILSTPHKPGGYHTPANYEEVVEWRERMHKKAVKMLAIINPVLQSCNRMFPERGGIEQLKIFEKVG